MGASACLDACCRAAGLTLLDWPDGPFYWAPAFWTGAQADALLTALDDEPAWTRHRVRLFGREHLAPRLSAWHGEAGARYRYSGSWHEPHPWTPALIAVRDRLVEALGLPFNSVLANRYRDGGDAMGWHRDDEPELGGRPVIASASFGAPRRFALRHDSGRREALALGHGSLLVMAGDSQSRWRHALPRTARPVGGRINLTFRQVRNAALPPVPPPGR
ncbi:MAG: alpha-ketoglutarate-dependent dioxygenase AlkB [Xanthomonadales bacterium]|nr:alpha-ketoglutarate-dependent dioxygenase AlkB [Xanthomonadales bacterium]